MHGDLKLSGVYYIIGSFIINLIMVFIVHDNLIPFTLLLFSMIATYGVLTDLVAHLFPYNFTPMPWKRYVHKILSGRTHDIYGILIAMFMESYAVYIAHPLLYGMVINIALEAGTLYSIIIWRFYH